MPFSTESAANPRSVAASVSSALSALITASESLAAAVGDAGPRVGRDATIPSAAHIDATRAIFMLSSSPAAASLPRVAPCYLAFRARESRPMSPSRRSELNPKTASAPGAIPPAEVRAKHKQYLFPACTNYYEEPV